MLWLIPLSFEAGFWSGALGYRRRARERTRAILIYGRPQPRSIPMVDDMLRKSAGQPTAAQARATKYTVKGMRWFANTKAFEYLMLSTVRSYWPSVLKPAQVNKKVRWFA